MAIRLVSSASIKKAQADTKDGTVVLKGRIGNACIGGMMVVRVWGIGGRKDGRGLLDRLTLGESYFDGRIDVLKDLAMLNVENGEK